jgi:hypothetical protein
MSHPCQTALLIFGYWALLFSCSSTVTSFVLSNEFSKIPIRAAQMPHLRKSGIYVTSSMRLLQEFGASPASRFLIWYCELCLAFLTSSSGIRCRMHERFFEGMFSLIAGIMCTILQVVLYIWYQETLAVKGAALAVAIVGIWPVMFIATQNIQNKTGTTTP